MIERVIKVLGIAISISMRKRKSKKDGKEFESNPMEMREKQNYASISFRDTPQYASILLNKSQEDDPKTIRKVDTATSNTAIAYSELM